MNVYLSEELIRTILSFGGEIEVVAPSILREQIAKRISSMVAHYKN